jgi:hypothetical protein
MAGKALRITFAKANRAELGLDRSDGALKRCNSGMPRCTVVQHAGDSERNPWIGDLC